MCDTFIINKDNKRYFLKNSDRSINEINMQIFIPRMKHQEKEVKCTYISIPQVKETYSMMLIKPSWIWGAEMGINEYGVSLGNEAVFTKNVSKVESLIGMDYLRLALERSKTAKEALNVIIDLLKIYGQGGNCGYDHEFYYNNSYLIVDKTESYVLETIGKDYAYKKVDSYNISNKLSLAKDYDYSTFNVKKGIYKDNTDLFYTTFSMSKTREKDGINLRNKINMDTYSMEELLSFHHFNNADTIGSVSSICMHKNLIGDHTTGSFIVDYNYSVPIIYIGGVSPCISLYKPYILSNEGFLSSDINKEYNRELKRMILSRLVLSNYINKEDYKNKIHSLNKEFIYKIESIKSNGSLDDIIKYSNETYEIEEEILNKYNDLINKVLNKEIKLKGMYNKYTKKLSINPFSNDLKLRKLYK